MIQLHLSSVQILMDDVYENIYDNDLNRRRKILIVFDEMIADIMKN